MAVPQVREYTIGGYSAAAVAAQASQDLTAVSVVQAGGSTTASFSRLLRTGDSADAAIGCGAAQTLVFACGTGGRRKPFQHTLTGVLHQVRDPSNTH
jgi:hypothetical protein